MKEAGVVIGLDGNPMMWHVPDGRSASHIPDSHDLWNFIWENRHKVYGIAHSHPGSGEPHPSHTDLTTFAAIEAALGKRLVWWIVSADAVSIVCWEGPKRLGYKTFPSYPVLNPSWTEKLRELSNGPEDLSRPTVK